MLQNVIQIDELADLFHKFFDFLLQHFLLHNIDARRQSEAFLSSLLCVWVWMWTYLDF